MPLAWRAIEEALQLRASGVVKPILLLEGFYSPGDLPVLVTNNIQTVVHCEEQLQALEQAQLETPVMVWLKVDSGMHRLGFALNNIKISWLVCTSARMWLNHCVT